MSNSVSFHFTKKFASKEAKKLNQINSRRNPAHKSSGWNRFDYVINYRPERFLRKWEVTIRNER